jgi:hypothetical protein
LFNRYGDRVGRVTGTSDSLSTGHSMTWSRDSRWILVVVQPTGTGVAGYQYLLAAFVQTHRVSMVVPSRVASDAFAG